MTMLTRRTLLIGAIGIAIAVAAPQAIAEIVNPDDIFPVKRINPKLIKPQFRRTIVPYPETEWPGTIIVDTESRHLYLILEGGEAIRYGVGVGREGFAWSGEAVVGHKTMWPEWNPPPEMVARDDNAARWADGMPGGPQNPLGARALYLYANGKDTLYRIHGTNDPKSIGKNMSSGCIRMLNEDIIDLYRRVTIGSRVVVLGPAAPLEAQISGY
jgi:lipoprotein-anchoring transpeptidase ErfK/SrfK